MEMGVDERPLGAQAGPQRGEDPGPLFFARHAVRAPIEEAVALGGAQPKRPAR